MLLWFDLSPLPGITHADNVTLRLTRSSGDIPSPYVVYAYAFGAGNDCWYIAPAKTCGNRQQYTLGGAGNIPWGDAQGEATNSIDSAAQWWGQASTWSGDCLEITLPTDEFCAWLTGQSQNNGLLLKSSRTISPLFLGSGATDPANLPTLVVHVPEPACHLMPAAVRLLAGSRRRRRADQATKH